jgi:hypothetical protein
VKASYALVVVGLLELGACASAEEEDAGESADELVGFSAAKVSRVIVYGGYSENTPVSPGTVEAVKFTGSAGDDIEASVMYWGKGTAVLIGPNGLTKLAGADPTAKYTRDARIRFKLTRSGTHYLAYRARKTGGPDNLQFHLEKRGATLPSLASSAFSDPCAAHPWPMRGQCRDARYRSGEEGPMPASLVSSTSFSFTGLDTVDDIAVARNGVVHLLHGPRSKVFGNIAAVYSAVDKAGNKILSQRLNVGDLERPLIALASDGTPYVLTNNRATPSADLLRIGQGGEGTSVGNLSQPGQNAIDVNERLDSAHNIPILRLDPQIRPYLRTVTAASSYALDSYLGNVVRFEPGTGLVTTVSGALSPETPVTSNPWAPFGVTIDAAHLPSGQGGLFAHWNVYSIATKKLLWSTSGSVLNNLNAPRVHTNGDIVFFSSLQSSGRSSDLAVELWSVNGTRKGVVNIGPDFFGTKALALDAVGRTYAMADNRVIGIDESGASRFDITLPERGRFIALGPDRTLHVASDNTLMTLR